MLASPKDVVGCQTDQKVLRPFFLIFNCDKSRNIPCGILVSTFLSGLFKPEGVDMVISRKSGFTLLECITVIAVVGIMAVIAIPAFSVIIEQRRLSGAARMVMSDLMAARMQAVSNKNEFRVFFAGNNPSYQILDDKNNNGTINAGETVITRNIQSEYKGVAIIGASANPIFYPRGTALGTTVALTNLQGSKYVIVALTGRVRISDAPP